MSKVGLNFAQETCSALDVLRILFPITIQTLMQVGTAAGRLDLSEFVRSLPPETRLMVEGGSAVISSFLHSGEVDRLVATVAPVFVGAGGIPVTPKNGMASETVSSGKVWSIMQTQGTKQLKLLKSITLTSS